MKTIPLTQGKVAIVDAADYEWLSQWKWYALRIRHVFYAVRKIRREGGGQTTLYMHVLVAGTPPGHETDHINGDGLDNRRLNLRIGDNQHGFRRQHPKNTSGRRGVSWKNQKWWARIGHRGRNMHIGYFDDLDEAGHAFDSKARELGWPEEGLNYPIRSL